MVVRRTEDHDVVLLGGGPAGSSAAGLLSQWGHDVALVDREGERGLAESLPPSCVPLLEVLGFRRAVDEAPFVRATGNTVWWGTQPRRVEFFPHGALGYQVDRAVLDALLRARAVGAGVTMLRPATALAVERMGELLVTTVATAEGERTLRSRWVLDCTGRAGFLGRKQRRVGEGSRTLALVAVWESPAGWGLPDETHTLVESAGWGWGWSVPVSASRRYFTVMLDPAATPLGGGADLQSRYGHLLASLPALGAMVRDRALVGPAWACDATPYTNEAPAERRVLCVGDAASFIDPLSSFGVKKALASAWLAAVTVHTGLISPDLEGAATQLFAAREADYVTAASRELGALSREAQRGGSFWGSRAQFEPDEGDAASRERLRNDPQVLGAFQSLRERPTSRLRRSPQLGIVPHPLIRGNVVVLEPHLVLPGLDTPLRYVRSIDLVTAMEVAEQLEDVGEMYTRYCARMGSTPLPDFLGAIAVLVGKGGAVFA